MADDKPQPQDATHAKTETIPASDVASPNPELEQWGDAPAKMRKAIQLKITLYIEGEDTPAHDFSRSTIDALHDIITAGCTCHPELSVTIKQIVEK